MCYLGVMGTTELATTETTISTDAADLTRADVASWLVTHRSENTRKAYARDLSRLLDWLADNIGDVHVYDITPAMMAGYARSLTEQGLAASTVNRRLAAASSFFRWAIVNERTDNNPAGNTDLVKREAATVQHAAALTAEETTALIGAARDAGERDHLIVLVLVLTGIRVSELLSAKGADVRGDRGHCTLTVRGKGNKTRAVVLPAVICALIVDIEDDAYLVTDDDGGQLNRWQIIRVLARLQKVADINTKVTPHVLRATMVTESLEAGVSLWVVQDAVGHADSRTTRGYQRRGASLDKSPSYALAARFADDA